MFERAETLQYGNRFRQGESDPIRAPVTDRLEDPNAEIADLEDRIERQVANLKAEEIIDRVHGPKYPSLLCGDRMIRVCDRAKGSNTVRVAHLALHSTNLNPLVEGPALMLAAVHRKVHRAGYRKTAAD